MWRPVIANDTVQTFGCSTAASVGTSATAFASFTALASGFMTKIPYTTAQLTGGNVQGRLVSGCLRIRYTGTEDGRAGVVSLFEDPDHLDVQTTSSNNISLFDSCGKERVSGEGNWHQINWSGPAKQNEQEYVQTAGFTGNSYTHVIAVNGTCTAAGALGPATFEYEIWENLEYLGRDVVGKTNNSLDPQGTSHVIGAAKSAQSGSEPFSASNSKTSGEFIRSVLSPVPGGSLVGNGLSALVHTLGGSGAGRIYETLRSRFNSNFRNAR